jgi:peptidoglycan/xylan/chitin deacetylase (PgdA/CDA1 family)
MGLVKNILYKISNKSLLKFLPPQNIYPYYHIVGDLNVAHIKHLYKFKTIQQFCDDLDFLTNNYNAVDPKDVFLNQQEESSKKRGKKFLLTFDDGLSEVYYNIYPILKEKGLKAIFFINPNFIDNNDCLYKHKISIIIDMITNNSNAADLNQIAELIDDSFESKKILVEKIKKITIHDTNILDLILEKLNVDLKSYLKDNRPYLSKVQIQEMIADGFLFGGHTMSHPRLLELSLPEQKSEIIDSIEWLKDNFGIEYSLFAFPFTDKGISKYIMDEIFSYDPKTIVFGNSGIKKDIDPRIIQRFSLENPHKKAAKLIVLENIYKYYNKIIGNYRISRE